MNADYITNPLYENNPFIEALPPMLAGKDLIRALASIPPYSDNDRDRSTGERLQLLSSLYEYYQPLSMTIDLYCEVYTALQHCYGQYSVQRETAALQNDYALMQGTPRRPLSAVEIPFPSSVYRALASPPHCSACYRCSHRSLSTPSTTGKIFIIIRFHIWSCRPHTMRPLKH